MRHKKAKIRAVAPDPLHNSVIITKFINRMMKDGKRSIAQEAFYGAFEILKEKGNDPFQVFDQALQNVSPKVEVRARRVGGANYQVPVEVRPERKMSLAIRWLLEATRKRSNKEYRSFSEKLAAEILDASQNMGEAIKKRDTTLKMAEANRAFAHFRW